MDILEVGEGAQLITKDIQEEAGEASLFNDSIRVREEAPVSVKYILEVEEEQDQPYIRDIQDKVEEASLIIKNIQEEEEEDIQEH